MMVSPDQIETYVNTFMGYPTTTNNNFNDVIPMLKYTLNNVGDPFTSSNFHANTHQEEREVLQFFADLWQMDEHWGYVTSSGTEGNLQGLFIGREMHPNAVFYTSKDSHYSIFKIAHILRLDLVLIESQENGEMNYQDFDKKLRLDRPALINSTIGTTMKGAIDNTREIYRILMKHAKHDYYLHLDGALMGFVLPFYEKDLLFKKHAHSISISGHKFLGVPFPCGVFLTSPKYIELIRCPVEYIGSTDVTISGSRNGHSVLFLLSIIKQKGYDGFQHDIEECFQNAEYLLEQLETRLPHLQAWRNQNSITVVIKRPSQRIITKWQLATSGDISHVILMPQVTKKRIDEFMEDLIREESNVIQ